MKEIPKNTHKNKNTLSKQYYKDLTKNGNG